MVVINKRPGQWYVHHHWESAWNKHAKPCRFSYLDHLEIRRFNPGLGVATTCCRYTVVCTSTDSYSSHPVFNVRSLVDQHGRLDCAIGSLVTRSFPTAHLPILPFTAIEQPCDVTSIEFLRSCMQLCNCQYYRKSGLRYSAVGGQY